MDDLRIGGDSNPWAIGLYRPPPIIGTGNYNPVIVPIQKPVTTKKSKFKMGDWVVWADDDIPERGLFKGVTKGYIPSAPSNARTSVKWVHFVNANAVFDDDQLELSTPMTVAEMYGTEDYTLKHIAEVLAEKMVEKAIVGEKDRVMDFIREERDRRRTCKSCFDIRDQEKCSSCGKVRP